MAGGGGQKLQKKLPKRAGMPHPKEYRAKCWARQQKAKQERIAKDKKAQQANEAWVKETHSREETAQELAKRNSYAWAHKSPSKRRRAIQRKIDGIDTGKVPAKKVDPAKMPVRVRKEHKATSKATQPKEA